MFTPDGRTDNGIQKYLVSKDVVIEMRYIIIQHRTAHHLTWLTLRHLDQLLAIGPRVGVTYSWLFKYVQQNTTGLIENNWAPHPLTPALSLE